MADTTYDIIVIGAGSGGLSVSLFMNKAGFKVLLADKSDDRIGGECLNDGCVPSKALIHIAKVVHSAGEAKHFGLELNGQVDIRKAMSYISGKQDEIREHENATFFRKEGLEVVLGEASFNGKNSVKINGQQYAGKKIVIATGSNPRKLKVPGVEKVKYYDNESVFHITQLPERLLVVGGGPIGIEMAQAFSRLGSRVTVVHQGEKILEHDEVSVTKILLEQLQKEGIRFIFKAQLDEFISANEATVQLKTGEKQIVSFDAVFAGIGRQFSFEPLQLHKAGIEVSEHKILVDEYLRTTNKNVFVCGDIAGSLQFSHEAELQGRILLNNFFSPFKKKLNNDHISWVTFTDPEVATFGLSERQLQKKKINYKKLETTFKEDDRAVVDDYAYAKLILYISQGSLFHKEKILGGTMVAPKAGELIQELILANAEKLSINAIFNKIYPYPVASRINQFAILQHKQARLTEGLKKILHFAYKIFS